MKKFPGTGAGLFAIIGALHLMRLFNGWEVRVAGFIVPLWWSDVAVVLAGVMAWGLWKESRL